MAVRPLTTIVAVAMLLGSSDTDTLRPPVDRAHTSGALVTPDELPGIYLLVGDRSTLNRSEQRLRRHLSTRGLQVTLLDDDRFQAPLARDCRLLVMSKTVVSTLIGDRLKFHACPIIFWEDNQQKLDMLATIRDDGSHGTAWHAGGETVIVEPGAPEELTSGLEGAIRLYGRSGEITYAPRGKLVADATVVARLFSSQGPAAVYVLERGARLADGTLSVGRRVYFGLYDDTFRLLTPEGLRLFDAAVDWASSGYVDRP